MPKWCWKLLSFFFCPCSTQAGVCNLSWERGWGKSAADDCPISCWTSIASNYKYGLIQENVCSFIQCTLQTSFINWPKRRSRSRSTNLINGFAISITVLRKNVGWTISSFFNFFLYLQIKCTSCACWHHIVIFHVGLKINVELFFFRLFSTKRTISQ